MIMLPMYTQSLLIMVRKCQNKLLLKLDLMGRIYLSLLCFVYYA